MDSPPAHTTRVWTALRVRGLPTLETDAFRVQNAMRFTHSSCPSLRRFFYKNKGNGFGDRGQFLPASTAHTACGQPTAPLLIGRQVAGARARERTGGAAQGGRGAACPTPGAALGGGGTRGGRSRSRPLCSAPLGGPRYGSPERTTYRVRREWPQTRASARWSRQLCLHERQLCPHERQKTVVFCLSSEYYVSV